MVTVTVARAAGADGIELDARKTAHRHLVFHHDACLPGSGRLTNIEVAAVPSRVPELHQALVACVPLAVDLEVEYDPDADPGRRVAQAVALGCSSPHPFVTQVDAGPVAATRAAGPRTNVWTVNADAGFAAMLALGVDAVITDRVAAAVRTVCGSGWNGGGSTG